MTGETSLEQRFADAMGQLLGPDFPNEIGLAVSGGGDSMAMLYLAHNWTRVYGLRLWIATVDHGLRPGSDAEAAMVAAECRALGWPHATLHWQGDGHGNMQDAARKARLGLIQQWRGGLRHVLMAHTRDDLAETFLIRLRRGSGVEGLSAMQSRRRVRVHDITPGDITGDRPPPPAVRTDHFEVLRPCLGLRRDALRHYLRTLKGQWVDDPSNENPAYDRVRMRRLLDRLDPEGLGVETLATTAERMMRARIALGARAASVWAAVGREGRSLGTATGEILLDRDLFAPIERDTQMRLLAAALQYVGSGGYRPRADATEALLDRLLSGGAGTLAGCEARCAGPLIRIFREPAAVDGKIAVVGDGTLWDGRWRVFHPDFTGMTVRALGADGWAQCPSHARDAVPFQSGRALPSIWQADRLAACDALGFGPGQTTRLCPAGLPGGDFADFLVSR